MARLSELKVGDKITVNPSHGGAFEFRSVKEIHKNGIVDNKGQKWTMSGNRWGCTDSWYGQSVQPYDKEHEQWNKARIEEIALRRKQNELLCYRWRDATEEIVNAAYAVIKRNTQ